MLVVYMCVSIFGGLMAALLFSQNGLMIGLLAAPLGGSFLVAAAAVLLALTSSSSRKPHTVPHGVVWC